MVVVRLRSTPALVVGVLIVGLPANARTLEVHPPPLSSSPAIQLAIEHAAAGDTILIGPGEYMESLHFRGRNIVVRSTAGPEQTVLHSASSTTPVVTFDSGEQRTTVLSGLTITGGSPGVFILESEPSIIGNVIIDNQADFGGGICCLGNAGIDWSPLIQGNAVRANQVSWSGGGIAVRNWMLPWIIDNEVSDNRAEGDGGGIWIAAISDNSIVRGNRIARNVARDHGGGIYAGLATNLKPPLAIEISWNIVAHNRAERKSTLDLAGGGIWLNGTTAWVHHNTVADNAGTSAGNGIAVVYKGQPLIEQNILAFNQNGNGIWCHGDARATARDNLVWSATGDDGGGACLSWWEFAGNERADPQFCNRLEGDYSLGTGSPGLHHPTGPLGAITEPGCQTSPTVATTWGSIKTLFR